MLQVSAAVANARLNAIETTIGSSPILKIYTGAIAPNGAWAASTAYSVGQRVTNGGNTYQVTTAGTSASSGGPSGTNASITDGTVTWTYVANALPANDAAAATGTLLCSMTLPASWLTSAAGGAVALSGTWSGAGVANGNAGYYRIYDPTGTTSHIQGAINYAATPWSPSTAIALGAKVSAAGNVYNCTTAGTTAGTGSGPSGTGAAITDGTVTWAYVGPVGDMTLTNVNVAISQTLAVNTYSLTDGNYP